MINGKGSKKARWRVRKKSKRGEYKVKRMLKGKEENAKGRDEAKGEYIFFFM